MKNKIPYLCLFLLPFLFNCQSSGKLEQLSNTVTPTPTKAHQVELQFSPKFQGAELVCGQTYRLGKADQSYLIQDFRMYIHALEFKNSEDEWIALTLEQDEKWQQLDVALLDFENAQASCFGGTPDINKLVKGQLPPGNYKGLRFKLGVPFGLNHQDASRAKAPFSLSSMFWNWRNGYKYLRLDIKNSSENTLFPFHLGATGCLGHGIEASYDVEVTDFTAKHGTGGEPVTTVPAYCTQPNTPQIHLPEFDFSEHDIGIDLEQLLQATDLYQNQPETAQGCQSEPHDLDCKDLFHQLGMFFDNTPSPGQRVFMSETKNGRSKTE